MRLKNTARRSRITSVPTGDEEDAGDKEEEDGSKGTIERDRKGKEQTRNGKTENNEEQDK